MPFVKLDTGILNSTLWVEREQREVFITALLMAMPYELREPRPQLAWDGKAISPTGFVVPPGWYGFVAAAGPGIVRMTMGDHEAGMTALHKLGEPDDQSRSSEFDGRRLVRVDGGYLVLNYMKYRDKDATAADRSKRYRQRLKETSPPLPVTRDVSNDTRSETRGVTKAEAEAEADTPPTPSALSPLKGGKGAKMAPDRFLVTKELQAWAREAAPLVNIRSETALFRANTFKTARTDWPKTWQGWMLREQKRLVEMAARDTKRGGSTMAQEKWDQGKRWNNALGLGQPQPPAGPALTPPTMEILDAIPREDS